MSALVEIFQTTQFLLHVIIFQGKHENRQSIFSKKYSYFFFIHNESDINNGQK